jgi:hypothetical protein
MNRFLPGKEGGSGEEGGEGGQWGEMTQTMCAHMNKWTIIIKEQK